MSLIPDNELRRENSINLAPLVDFLFLVVAVLATLAITRSTLHDTELHLVQMALPHQEALLPAYNTQHLVHLSVTDAGTYKWVTEMNEYLMQDPASIQRELLKQLENGLLPKEKQQTKVLLHIDKNAPWEPIAKIIFSVRALGFQIHPVYESVKNQNNTTLL